MTVVRRIIGALLLTDGVLTALMPARRRWRSRSGDFDERPLRSRVVGIVTAIGGILLARARTRS